MFIKVMKILVFGFAIHRMEYPANAMNQAKDVVNARRKIKSCGKSQRGAKK